MPDWPANPPKSIAEQFDLAQRAREPLDRSPVVETPRDGLAAAFDKAQQAPAERPSPALSPQPAQQPARSQPTPLSYPSPGQRHNMPTPLGIEVTAAHGREALARERAVQDQAAQARAMNDALNRSRPPADLEQERDRER